MSRPKKLPDVYDALTGERRRALHWLEPSFLGGLENLRREIGRIADRLPKPPGEFATTTMSASMVDLSPPKKPKVRAPLDRPFPDTPTFNAQPIRWLIRHYLGYRFKRRKRACPACGVKGAWDAYGLWWGDRQVRRWLCKWCGFYDAVDGRFWALADLKKGTWVLPLEKIRENVDPESLDAIYAVWQDRVASGELTTPQATSGQSYDPLRGLL